MRPEMKFRFAMKKIMLHYFEETMEVFIKELLR